MMFKTFFLGAIALMIAPFCFSQINWIRVDSLFGALPPSVQVYKSSDPLDGKPNIAYYVSADLKDPTIDFTAETADGKRYTPAQYYQQHQSPLLVVNCTFFNTITGQNLNTVIKNKNPLSVNLRTLRGPGKDSISEYRIFRSAIGINEKREADVAWLKTDSATREIKASQHFINPVAERLMLKGSVKRTRNNEKRLSRQFTNWRMTTAVGGGPVLVQKGDTLITNNEEMMFAGKSRFDKHPRTAMGYTREGKLIILVIQGRFPGISEGATLVQEALILKDLGCYEALNLDGGGSSCLLVNGKETIRPSDKEGQRAVPAVFMIK